MNTDLKKLKEIIADLTIENIELKEAVKKERDSSLFWFKKYDDIEQELKSFKGINVKTDE